MPEERRHPTNRSRAAVTGCTFVVAMAISPAKWCKSAPRWLHLTLGEVIGERSFVRLFFKRRRKRNDA
jgi:hypothetical protein